MLGQVCIKQPGFAAHFTRLRQTRRDEGRLALAERLVRRIAGEADFPFEDGETSIGPAGDFLFLSTPSGVRALQIGPLAPAVLASVLDRVPHDVAPTPVTLNGRWFTQGMGTRVFFGTDEASAVQVLDDTTLVATPPAGTPGPVDVRVVSSAGEGVLRAGFAYTPGIRVRGLAELTVYGCLRGEPEPG